jgi:hypothetical protein
LTDRDLTKHRGRGPGRKRLIDRIMEKISPEPNSGCWLWKGAATSAGYGEIHVPGRGGRLAHRFLYEMLRGPIPDGLQLDHLCRVRCCVNPDHLEPVTCRDNLRRSPLVARMRGESQRNKTHCPAGHPYDATNTYWYRNRRNCRECSRIRRRKK